MKITENNKEYIKKEFIAPLAISAATFVAKSTLDIIKTTSTSFISLDEWDYAYQPVNKLLYKIDPNKYSKHRSPSQSPNYYSLETDVSYYTRMKNGGIIKVVTDEINRNNGNSIKTITIYFYSKYKYVNRNIFLRETRKSSDKNHVSISDLIESQSKIQSIAHTFDNIILTDEIKTELINKLDVWRESKKWYKDHQLVHKIGVLLYGKPGTGKSSVAKAISCMFNNAPILMLNPSRLSSCISDLIDYRQRTEGTLIILIEDFDMFFEKRDDEDDIVEDNATDINYNKNIQTTITEKIKNNDNLNMLFQVLDGVYSTDNTIYIATTNYKERLDSALVRHGRFDIQCELKYFEKEDAIRCVSLFGYDESILDLLDIEYPVQPAFLQSKIMEYRTNKLYNDKRKENGSK